jgi:D-alanyl-D-alanine carboxypeptidase
MTYCIWKINPMKNPEMKKHILLFIVPLFFIGCSGASKFYSLNETKEFIDAKFQDTLFAHAHWGVLIESLTTGDIWYEQNMDKMFMPASNEKIPTAATALTTLGPDFVFTTSLSYKGEILDSVLYGDLIVNGIGDPTLHKIF